MPLDIKFSDGQGLDSFGKGRPDPDNFASTVNEILENPEGAHSQQRDKLQGVISSYNQKVHEIRRLESAFVEIGRNQKLHELTQEAKQDIKYLGVLNNYEETFNYWAKDLNGFLKSEFGGRVPPDIQAYVLNVKNQIEDKQLRILWSDSQKQAMDSLGSMSASYRQDLFDGDIVSAVRNYNQLKGSLNSYIEMGLFDKELSRSLNQGYGRTFNDTAGIKLLEMVDALGKTHGFLHQKNYYNKHKGLIDLSQTSPKIKESFAALDQSLDEGELDFTNRSRILDQTMETYLKAGLGNPLGIRSEARAMQKMLDSKLAETNPKSKNYAGLKAFRSEVRSFDNLIGSMSHAVSQGMASPYKDLLKPLGARGYESVFKKLGMTDIFEKTIFMQQHSAMLSRYGYDKDPFGAMVKMQNDFQRTQSADGLTGPIDIVSQLQDEHRNIMRLTGKSGLSQDTKKRMHELLDAIPTNAEDSSLQQDIYDWFSQSGVSLGDMMKNSDHPVTTKTGLELVTRHANSLFYLSPDQVSWQQVKANIKNSDYKKAVDKLSEYFLEKFPDDITELANANKATIDDVVSVMSLNVVQGSTLGIRGGPLGMRDYRALTGEIEDIENLPETLEDLFAQMKDGMVSGFKTRDQGRTSILSDGNLGKAMDVDLNSAGVISELFTGDVEVEQFETHFVGDLDPVDRIKADAERAKRIGRKRRSVKTQRIKLFKKLSDVTGLPQTSFTDRISINQSPVDRSYYLTLQNPSGSFSFLEYKPDFPFKGRISISEEEMAGLLEEDINLEKLTDRIIKSVLRSP